MRRLGLVVGWALLLPVGAARAQGEAHVAPPVEPTAVPANAAPARAVAGAPAFQLGVNLLPMLLGRVTTGPSGADTSSHLDPAYGFGLWFGYRVLGGLSAGVAPQVVFHLSSKDSAGYRVIDSEREYDLMARIAYAYTLMPRLEVYAEILPGYAFVTYNEITLGVQPPTARGMVLAAGLGTAFAVTDLLFASVGVGYQQGFQTSHGISNREVRTKFLRMAVGAGVRF
jgi:opacity protein-like surface antigen